MANKQVFVFYYEWQSTKGNHAGMAHLVRAFKKEYTGQVVLIKEPSYQIEKNGRLKLWSKWCWFWFTVVRLALGSKNSDEIFFTEYGGIGWQTKIAGVLKSFRPAVRRTGLMHLPLPVLKEYYKSELRLRNVLNQVDSLMVFGSSLERELQELNVQPTVTRTFHYVDDFYLNDKKPQLVEERPLEVLFVGNLMRNYNILQSVIGGGQSASVYFSYLRWGLQPEGNVC